METPTGGATGESTTQVGQEVILGRFPSAVAASERFLIMYRREPLRGFGQRQALPGVSFCL